MKAFNVRSVSVSLALLAVLAARSLSQPDIRFRDKPFELSVSQRFDNEGRTFVVVSTTLPYRRLVFFKRPDGFEASYRVYMDLRDRKGNLASGEVWEVFASAENYQETRSVSAVSTSRRSFPVEPGEYTVKVTVEIIKTSLRFFNKKDIRILDRDRGRLEISDPVFSTPIGDALGSKPPAGEMVLSECTESSKVRYRMNADGIYMDFDIWPRIVYNLVTPVAESPGGGYVVSIRVTDSGGKVVLYGRNKVPSAVAGHRMLCIDLNVDDFAIDEYEISTVMEVPGTDERSLTRGAFLVLLNRGTLSKNFKQTLRLLSFIADGDELADLENSTTQERMDAWRRFWKGRDPNPDTEENEEQAKFLRRVMHVLQSFSDSRPGWETDRGRIYIKYGEPDNIEDRYGRMSSGNYQLWYYYSRNIVFIFVDSVGTGDYQLLTTRSI